MAARPSMRIQELNCACLNPRHWHECLGTEYDLHACSAGNAVKLGASPVPKGLSRMQLKLF